MTRMGGLHWDLSTRRGRRISRFPGATARSLGGRCRRPRCCSGAAMAISQGACASGRGGRPGLRATRPGRRIATWRTVAQGAGGRGGRARAGRRPGWTGPALRDSPTTACSALDTMIWAILFSSPEMRASKTILIFTVRTRKS